MLGLFKKLADKPIPSVADQMAAPVTGTLDPQSPIELKVKACSLAAEAKIIRKLEQRQKRPVRDKDGELVTKYNNQKNYGKVIHRLTEKSAPTFWKLRNHRTKEVRSEARCTHLARTFLKGQEYKVAENKAELLPDFVKIAAMVKRYAVGDSRLVAQKFEEWKQAAVKHWGSYE